MADFHAKRQKFKSAGSPPVPQSHRENDKPTQRKGNSLATERDLKRFEAFLFVERGVSPLTVKKYLYSVKQLKAWARRKRRSLSELTTLHCRRWLLGLAKEAYSTSTINGRHSAASLFFWFLISEGDLKTNPFDNIPYLPKGKPLPRFLNPEEAERLMKVPDTFTYTGLLDRAVMELLYSSGLRVTELINLRLADVNLDKRRVVCMGKGSKQRIVIFGRDARTWLKKYLAARANVSGAMKSPYLFLKSDGKQLYGTFIWRHIHEHGLMIGLKGVSPRVLRHSFATHLHAGGASIRHVQELLGHDDIESTQVYTHLVQTHLRKTYDQHHPRASLNSVSPRKRYKHEAKGEDTDK